LHDVTRARFQSSSSRLSVVLAAGVNINDQSNMTPGSAANVMLGVDMIREFRVLTSTHRADHGRKMGGIVNAVSKSGTNQFHGTAHLFNRNDAFDSRNFSRGKSRICADISLAARLCQPRDGSNVSDRLYKSLAVCEFGYSSVRDS
jgi:hypothetical protein